MGKCSFQNFNFQGVSEGHEFIYEKSNNTVCVPHHDSFCKN